MLSLFKGFSLKNTSPKLGQIFYAAICLAIFLVFINKDSFFIWIKTMLVVLSLLTYGRIWPRGRYILNGLVPVVFLIGVSAISSSISNWWIQLAIISFSIGLFLTHISIVLGEPVHEIGLSIGGVVLLILFWWVRYDMPNYLSKVSFKVELLLIYVLVLLFAYAISFYYHYELGNPFKNKLQGKLNYFQNRLNKFLRLNINLKIIYQILAVFNRGIDFSHTLIKVTAHWFKVALDYLWEVMGHHFIWPKNYISIIFWLAIMILLAKSFV
jgi:hypothetical protein